MFGVEKATRLKKLQKDASAALSGDLKDWPLVMSMALLNFSMSKKRKL